MGTAVLVTGAPGSGKTTLIRAVVAALPIRCGGFVTEEVREGTARVGFRLLALDGPSGLLAHARGIRGPCVGRYRVDVEQLDLVGVAALERAVREADLVVVDEIGKMELCSPRFLPALEAALASPRPVLGTVLSAAHPVLDALKRRPEVEIYRLTAKNRDHLADALRARLSTEVPV